MALDAAQILDCLLLMGLPARTDVVYGYYGDGELLRQSEIARKALENVDAAQEAKVVSILTQYALVEFDTDTLQTEGIDSSPARQRAMLKGRLANTIGVTLPSLGITTQRG